MRVHKCKIMIFNTTYFIKKIYQPILIIYHRCIQYISFIYKPRYLLLCTWAIWWPLTSRRLATANRSRQLIANFSNPVYFAPPLNGFPLELGICAGRQETIIMGLLSRRRDVTIASAGWIQCTNVTDRQTDRHRATAKTALTNSVAR